MLLRTCFDYLHSRSFASAAPAPASEAIAAALHSSREVSILPISLFLFGYSVGPIIWGPASELAGRRPVCALCLWAYTLFHLGQALAKSMPPLIVTRFLAGFFACGPLNNGGGVVADMWGPNGRGPAMSVYSATVFLGPVLGPVVGGL